MKFRADKISVSIGAVLFFVILLTVALAATTGKNIISQDCHMEYDCYIYGLPYLGDDTVNPTQFMFSCDASVPTGATDTARNYCLVSDGYALYMCVTGNHFGSGINWIQVACTNSW